MKLLHRVTVTAILFGGKKWLCLIYLLVKKLTGCGTSGISSRKQYLVSLQEPRTSMDTKAEPRWGLAPCWEAVANDRGAQYFKNWNWITIGRPYTMGQIQYPETQTSPSQPQAHQHAPRAHTVSWWQLDPTGEPSQQVPASLPGWQEVGEVAFYILHCS